MLSTKGPWKPQGFFQNKASHFLGDYGHLFPEFLSSAVGRSTHELKSQTAKKQDVVCLSSATASPTDWTRVSHSNSLTDQIKFRRRAWQPLICTKDSQNWHKTVQPVPLRSPASLPILRKGRRFHDHFMDQKIDSTTTSPDKNHLIYFSTEMKSYLNQPDQKIIISFL